MTDLKDGPAAGKTLMLHRSPFYLRVTWSPESNKFDACDQVGDMPYGHEDIFVYRRVAIGGRIHINPGGWYNRVTYKLNPDQPPDAVMRDNEKWQAWCREQYREEGN